MTDEEIVEEQEQIEEEVEQQPVAQRKDADHNFAEFREVARLQKQRIEELESRLAQNQPVEEEEKDEFDDLDPDDYVKVSSAKALATKLAKKQATQTAKQVVEEYIQQRQIVEDEQKMRNKHEDFDYVIENYAVPMIKNDPALAYKIRTSKNPAETAYKLAKISDEYEVSQMKQQLSPKAEKILKNASRPSSSNAVGTPLKTQAADFSNMSQQDIWAASQKYARGA